MNKRFDYIHLLCGGIKQDKSGMWVSTDLSEEDTRFGAPGGKLRVLASALLIGRYPDVMIFTGGGKGFGVPVGMTEERPLIADILRDELLEDGVPIERIILERESSDSYQELQELKKFADQYEGKTVAIMTNRYHLPRIWAMLQMKFPALHQNATIAFLVAEDVLIAEDAARWQTLIDDAYASEWMRKIIEAEENGRQQILDGTYNFR